MPENTNPPADTVEAPDAETTETTPTLSLEDMSREIAALRKEAAKYRTKAKALEDAKTAEAEAKRKAEQTAEERAAAAERKAAEALEAAEARIQTAERKAALAGKVANPDRVLRLMDDPEAFFNGTEPDVDAILKAFPEYAPKGTSVDIPGARTHKEPEVLDLEDFRGKGPDFYLKNRHKIPPSR